MSNLRLLIAVSLTTLILGSGCDKPGPVDTNSWSTALVVSQSRDSIDSSYSLQKWNNTLLALNSDAGLVIIYFLQQDEKAWREQKTSSPDSWLPLDCDPESNRLIISRGKMSSDKMDVSFLIVSIGQDGQFLISTENKMLGTVATVFGRQSPGVTFPGGTAVFARGALADSNICIPYSLRGDNSSGRFDDGPFAGGVFYSSDSGVTWQKEQIYDFYTVASSVRMTKGYNYFFSAKSKQSVLYCSRKSADNHAWTPPESVTETFGTSGFIRRFVATAEGDTVHLCWLDRRHEKTRLNPVYPNCENYEVAYCHRKDSDDAWGKDVILSEGLRYAYSPSISVEGNKIVVAWAGVKSDKDGRNEWNPSDIYYVTSKDSGNTWTKPVQVTDGFKDGITSGRPQVALYHNFIHLFYIQGKLDYQEVSAGMAKLNQPPWPIYYTQRPFAN